jgi:hypothetical protein
MDDPTQRHLRLALHRFLDLCRDARGRELEPDLRSWLHKVEMYAWACLAEYRHVDATQQGRLFANCLRLEQTARRLTGTLSQERRSVAA